MQKVKVLAKQHQDRSMQAGNSSLMETFPETTENACFNEVLVVLSTFAVSQYLTNSCDAQESLSTRTEVILNICAIQMFLVIIIIIINNKVICV